MTTGNAEPPIVGAAPDVTVVRGLQGWAQPITLPAADTADDPIDWSGSTFEVTSSQTDLITLQKSGTPPTVVLSLTEEQVAAMTVRWVHWYLSEDVVYAGNAFMQGRIRLVDPQ